MKMAAWLLGLVLLIGGIDDIATINRLKKQAEQAYQNGNYERAVLHYRVLVDSLHVQNEKVLLNLAHAYLQTGDTATAQRQYGQLMNAEDTNVKSVAYQQLGAITTHQEKFQDALALFKESLKANPGNEDSRYNYELVKKLQKEQEQQQSQSENNQDQSDEQKQQQNQEQQQSEEQQQNDQGESTDESSSEEQQSDQERQEGEQQPEDAEEQNAQQGEESSEGEKSEEEQSVSPLSERLQEMNISEEKARMILEAMRNNEMQYIQQNRRKPTKPRDRAKPDW